MCPKWKSEKHVNSAQGWALPQKDLAQARNDFLALTIECIVCHSKFSLQQGVKEAFMSDIPFVINDFQYNAREDGKVEVIVGQLETIEFTMPFEDVPKIYLTPYLKPVACVPGAITNSKFTIFSCASESDCRGEKRNRLGCIWEQNIWCHTNLEETNFKLQGTSAKERL